MKGSRMPGKYTIIKKVKTNSTQAMYSLTRTARINLNGWNLIRQVQKVFGNAGRLFSLILPVATLSVADPFNSGRESPLSRIVCFGFSDPLDVVLLLRVAEAFKILTRLLVCVQCFLHVRWHDKRLLDLR